ncbi:MULTISPECIES: prepilin peptidase [Vibrio]|uniref:A24 family peptidase n=1 Tax=Vibrio TaxID=662 RepID=UPI00142F0EE3|nr:MULTISPECIES: A24 family peptidase [Vibrio]
MIIFIWSILLIISVYDLRDNRIPNIWLLPLIISSVAHHVMISGWNAGLLALAAGGVAFLFGLTLYFIKAMAPGDVKLIGAVGVFIGWGNLLAACYWIIIGAGVVGILFSLQFFATRTQESKLALNKYSQLFLYGNGKALYSSPHTDNKLRMPFAPSVVIGLALYSYF